MYDPIKLTDGSAVQLDREHWSGLASQECDSFSATGRQVTSRLVAMKHADGRVLVYATVKDGFKLSPAGGEMLASFNTVPVAAALRRVSAQFSRGPYLLKQCLAQIDNRPAVPPA